MSRSNDFAQTFTAAHAEVGLSRVSVAHILRRIEEDPSFLFSEEMRRGAGQCPMHAASGSEDLDKVAVNSLLAYLFGRLYQEIAGNLPLTAEGNVMLPIPPRSPHGIDPSNRIAMLVAPRDVFLSVLRDATCHLLDGLIIRWAAGLLAEEEHYRALGSGEISTVAAATFVLRTVLEESTLYQRAGYDLLSITKTGSHTAIHICWAMAEAAPLLKPGLRAEEYDDLVRRSLKQVVPLSMASLGMLVHYMEESGTEPPDGLAIHPLSRDQTAFELDESGLIRLSVGPIKPFAKPDERYYTGCPAFYSAGMMKLYLDIVLAIALDYGVYSRLQEA
ncbi:hypothetical protein [Azospirillum sp. SYSU D00513]|uniref:hypothetical protein n=1 Tax=Azospirillum sp. SYSU D00513 TaxID=2812561 RepID=UPI001A9647D8|nr:hypothetical protein [Azospirillum sp. SYSU D00513]